MRRKPPPTQIHAKQRQYKALRHYFVEGRSSKDVTRELRDTEGAFRVLCHQVRRDPEPSFIPSAHPGPRTQPKKSAAHATIEQLRKRNCSVYEIADALTEQGTPLSFTAVGEVLRQLGFARLPHRRALGVDVINLFEIVYPEIYANWISERGR